jgi:pyruvyltransferase
MTSTSLSMLLRRGIKSVGSLMRKTDPKLDVGPHEQKGVELYEPEIFFWQKRAGHYNFGDHLARVISCKMLEVGLGSGTLVIDEFFRLLSIGSILHFANDGDVIWGSGRNGKIPDQAHRFDWLDVRAVRGPYTHHWLAKQISLPENLPYGDPGLLLPYLFDLSSPLFLPRDQEVGQSILVPNLNDVAHLESPDAKNVVLPTRSWYEVIRRILSARTIVTTSLHGLILAEAMGKRVCLVRLTDVEPAFKYEDYSLGAGRELPEFLSQLQGAEHEARKPYLTWDFEPLVRAFPFDKFGFQPDYSRVIATMREMKRRNDDLLRNY